MVHLAFFDNLSQLPACLDEAILHGNALYISQVWGQEEGPMAKKSRFRHRTGGSDENIASFQGVPYTFDQDCRLETSE